MAAEITGIEQAFGFEDLDFRNYMTAEDLRPRHLDAHHEAMADSDHPIVQLGAGWAAMELATFRGSVGRPTVRLGARLEALEQARDSWSRIDFTPLIDEQSTAARQVEAQVMEFRMKQAVGSLPAAEVVAHWLAYEPLDFSAVQHKMRQSRLDTIDAARAVKSMPTESTLERRQRAGLVAGYTHGLVVNNDQLHRYTSLPAPLRVERHRDERKRVNAIAVSAEDPHPRIMVDIKTDDRPRLPRPSVFQVTAEKDLVITPKHRLHYSLEALIDQEKGRASEYTQLMLSVMTERLIHRLDNFRSELTWRPK